MTADPGREAGDDEVERLSVTRDRVRVHEAEVVRQRHDRLQVARGAARDRRRVHDPLADEESPREPEAQFESMVVVGGPRPARPLDDDELLARRRTQAATGRQPNRGGTRAYAQRAEPPARQVVRRRLDLRRPGRELCEQRAEALELVRRSFRGYFQTQMHDLSLRQKSGPCRLTDLVDGGDLAVVPHDLAGAARRTG